MYWLRRHRLKEIDKAIGAYDDICHRPMRQTNALAILDMPQELGKLSRHR